jgi:hypothetical protein
VTIGDGIAVAAVALAMAWFFVTVVKAAGR